MTRVWTAAEAAGARARGIRQAAGATLADVAKAAKRVGLPWSSGRVGDFESGRISPTLPTLLAVTGALSDVSGWPLKLADLFEVEGEIRLNDELTMPSTQVRNLLSGERFQPTSGGDTPGHVARFFQDVGTVVTAFTGKEILPEHLRPGPSDAVFFNLAEGDTRLAKSIGVDEITAAAAMTKAWGKTFVQRRDELAGLGANAQKKGIVARRLKRELKDIIDGDDQ